MNTTLKAENSAVELAGCLASCGTAPVVMVNEEFHEGVTAEKADQLLARCQ
jgi:NADH-quinone oxidoreductase subunit E